MRSYVPIAEALVTYYRANHAAGHTNAMLNGARNTPDALVMAATHRQTENFGILQKDAVTLQTVENGKLFGMRRPLLIDHATTTVIFSGLIEEIYELQSKVKVLEKSK